MPDNTPQTDKPIMSVESEQAILKEIEKHCTNWRYLANTYVVFIIIFGVSAVATSVLVSVNTGSEDLMTKNAVKILACVSTISLSLLTAFNLVSNSNNARNAWRFLNAAIMLYKAGSICIEKLIEQYQLGENQLGNFGFNYGTNSDKDGIFTHDVAAADAAKKAKDDPNNPDLAAAAADEAAKKNKQAAANAAQAAEDAKKKQDIAVETADKSKELANTAAETATDAKNKQESASKNNDIKNLQIADTITEPQV